MFGEKYVRRFKPTYVGGSVYARMCTHFFCKFVVVVVVVVVVV